MANYEIEEKNWPESIALVIPLLEKGDTVTVGSETQAALFNRALIRLHKDPHDYHIVVKS